MMYAILALLIQPYVVRAANSYAYTPIRSTPTELQVVFPSQTSTFFMTPGPTADVLVAPPFGHLFLPPQVAAAFNPAFAGPHLIHQTFTNTCPYGVDKVKLNLEMISNSLQGSAQVVWALLVNGLAVAEYTSTKTCLLINPEGTFYPPIKTPTLEVSLEVVYYSGIVSVGGIQLAEYVTNAVTNAKTVHVSEGALTFRCANPFAGKAVSTMSVPSLTKQVTVGTLPTGFSDCEYAQAVQVLPQVNRLPPPALSVRTYAAWTALGPLLPALEEPFKTLPLPTAAYTSPTYSKISISGINIKMDALKTTALKTAFTNEVCGTGPAGTVRIQVGCHYLPPGFDPRESYLDVEIACP